jgi:hypothetical protein
MSRVHPMAFAAAVATSWLASGATAAPFDGRLASGQPSSTCTVSGIDKCTAFYSPTLDVTILNNWSIGTGFWDAAAPAGSAQALAASAGFAAFGLAGWVLPTGDGNQAPGALNQFLSIWNEVNGSFIGLSSQFDGVDQGSFFWASTLAPPSGGLYPSPPTPWFFRALSGLQSGGISGINLLNVVAVRAGDVAAAVQEPRVDVLLLAGLGAVCAVVKRRTG